MVLSRGAGLGLLRFTAWAALLVGIGVTVPAQQTGGRAVASPPSAVTNAANHYEATFDCDIGARGSPYIPVDSWIYPAVLRLYSMTFVDHIYLGMRPWTRANVEEILRDVDESIDRREQEPMNGQASEIYDALKHALQSDTDPCEKPANRIRIESAYSVARGITGPPLRDSFHLGSTIVNDYGRPYEGGLNNYSGLSGYATAGRFTLYARGELQEAPSAAGYSSTLAQVLSTNLDQIPFLDPTTGLPVPQATIPMGPVLSTIRGRWIEAYLSMHVLNHEVSIGKQDNWLGPGIGGGMAYSNNAENIYSFRINRVQPLRIPLLSHFTGPFRYDFLVGPLKGHTYPKDPWLHVEKISFRPTENLEFGFQRSVIWGGKGHEPVTLHTFLRSFFSFSAPRGNVKNTSLDPGARFGAFDFSYRLPFLRKWITLYSDSNVHDDISPIDAPRRASWRPGIYLSHVPKLPRLDIRVEAASTEPPIDIRQHGGPGRFMYWETIQRQGYTNNGQLFGDWIGREDKGGQAWITYHLSGNEWIQVSARNQKAAKEFISSTSTQYGTTLNDLSFQVVKRIGADFEVNGHFTLERYKAPIYLPGQQTVTSTDIQLTWYPTRKINF